MNGLPSAYRSTQAGNLAKHKKLLKKESHRLSYGHTLGKTNYKNVVVSFDLGSTRPGNLLPSDLVRSPLPIGRQCSVPYFPIPIDCRWQSQ